jgi:hypothetical protein
MQLVQLAGPEKKLLALALVFLVSSSAVSLSVPFGMGRIIDAVMDPASDVPLNERLAGRCSAPPCGLMHADLLPSPWSSVLSLCSGLAPTLVVSGLVLAVVDSTLDDCVLMSCWATNDDVAS